MSRHLIDLDEQYEQLKQRSSYGALAEKFGDELNIGTLQRDFSRVLARFRTVTEGAQPTSAQRLFSKLEHEIQESIGQIEKIARREHGKWVPLDESHAEELLDLEEHLAGPREELNQLLRGDSVDRLKLPSSLTEAYGRYSEGLDRAHGMLNGWFGRAQMEGLSAAVKNTREELQVWKKGHTARGLGFAKAGVMAGGAALIAHGAAISKGDDGESRNGAVRIGEVAGGLAAIGGALVFGKAR